MSEEDIVEPMLDIALAPVGTARGGVPDRLAQTPRVGVACSPSPREAFPAFPFHNGRLFFCSTRPLTDDEGRFAIERVVPGVYDAEFGTPTDERTLRGAVMVEPEQTARVTLGGTGRAVTGRFVPDPGHGGEVDWSSGQSVLITEPAQPPTFDKADGATPPIRERRQLAKMISSYPTYLFTVRPDGAFRVEDVPAGNYTASAGLYRKPEDNRSQLGDRIASGSLGFTVPEMPGGRSDEPLDIGAVQVTFIRRMEIGDTAPDFAGATLDDKPFKLSDLRGTLCAALFFGPRDAAPAGRRHRMC